MICSGMVNRSHESVQYNYEIKCVNTKLVLGLRMGGTLPLLPFEISWRVQDFTFYVTKNCYAVMFKKGICLSKT